MSEQIEKTVSRFQKWVLPRIHWVILAVVALNIPDILRKSDHQEPIRYWLAWVIIVAGIATVISMLLRKRKLARTQTECAPDKNDAAQ